MVVKIRQTVICRERVQAQLLKALHRLPLYAILVRWRLLRRCRVPHQRDRVAVQACAVVRAWQVSLRPLRPLRDLLVWGLGAPLRRWLLYRRFSPYHHHSPLRLGTVWIPRGTSFRPLLRLCLFRRGTDHRGMRDQLWMIRRSYGGNMIIEISNKFFFSDIIPIRIYK